MAQHPTNHVVSSTDAAEHLLMHDGTLAPVHNKIEAAILAATTGQGFVMGSGGVLIPIDLATQAELDAHAATPHGGGGIRVEDEGGTVVATATGLNFAGAGVTTTDAGSGEALVTIPGGVAGITVQDEGTPLATLGTTLNFVGSGVIASGTGATKTITINAGGGAAALNDLTDVDTAGLAADKVLAYNGTLWVPRSIALLTNTAPPAGSGSPSVGVSTEASRADHHHGAGSGGGTAAVAAYLVPISASDTGASFGIHNREDTLTAGSAIAIPVVFDAAVQIKSVGFYVHTAGAAGSVTRIGIFNDNTYNLHRPGTLAADLGTVATATTGFKSIASSFTPVVGTRYWIVIVAQGGVTAPVVRANNNPRFTFPATDPMGAPTRLYTGITGAFGSLAATTPGAAGSTLFPLITFATAGGVTTMGPVVEPQGDWRTTGGFGDDGYALLAFNGPQGSETDQISMALNSIARTQGAMNYWTQPIDSNERGLQAPTGTTRKIGAWYHATAVIATLTFTNAYSGMVRVYMIDWDGTTRRQTLKINDGSNPAAVDLGGQFDQGMWVGRSVSVGAAGTVVITATNGGGGSPNAVISGIFLDPN